ncbi:MAG: DUF6166 domain-containing protein [Pirellulales bacterium]|nr:DUF6166 domain-containing protein [Pirellulales bacterium]
MKIYRGHRSIRGAIVEVDGAPLAPANLPGHDVELAFEWGYNGSGPEHLALAILADCLGEESALVASREFKRKFVAGFDDVWEVSEGEIRAWFDGQKLLD